MEQTISLPAPPHVARLLVEWSRTLSARDPVRAEELAEQASAIAEKHDLPVVRRRAAVVLEA